MGFFDKLAKFLGATDTAETTQRTESKAESKVTNKVENISKSNMEDIILLPSSHLVEEEECGDNDSRYRMTFRLNDAFRMAKSHAAEVMMLNTYAPDKEYGDEGKCPYIAIQVDDDVYCPVAEFKENGTFEGAIDLTPLSGKFYFKAKKEYYGDMMYFYGLDRCDGYWENSGLCLVYPKEYVGTENELKLMKILDEAAESYTEEKMA